ncbi:MAG: DHH family phosphoesterase, partial [Burkholderiaceae bacterium]
MKIVDRDVPPRAAWALEQAGVHPLLARLYAARGLSNPAELDDSLARLLPPATLTHADEAARLLADALANQLRICIVADYDCDGATACAVALRGLRMLQAAWASHARQPAQPGLITYLVPDRVADGYGLTPGIARRVAATGAQVLVTVDNGIASLEGVAAARSLGLQVLVTDHHLPAQTDGETVLPADCFIVNPNQPGCTFESKSIAGVGVMFYVLLALRAELRNRGVFDTQNQPKIDTLLPLVALGT